MFTDRRNQVACDPGSGSGLIAKALSTLLVGLLVVAMTGAAGAVSSLQAQIQVIGDVDLDMTIEAQDALAVLTHVVGLPLPPVFEVEPNGDADCDGVLESFDALIILSEAVGVDVSSFCVGALIGIDSVDAGPDIDFDALDQQSTISVAAFDAVGDTVDGVDFAFAVESGGGVASVDGSGLVTALSVGAATISVTAVGSEVADTVAVSVTQVPASIQVIPDDATVAELETRQFTATVLDANDNPIPGETVTWSSDDPGTASVSGTGLVTGLLEGLSTTVRAQSDTDPSLEGTADITVLSPWYEKDWEEYGSTPELEADPELDQNGDGVVLVSGQAGLPWGGSAFVRGDFPGGGNNQTAGIDVYPAIADTDQPTELWLEVYVRYDANFRTAGDHKTIFMLPDPVPSDRWEIKVGLFGVNIVGEVANGVVHKETSCLPPVGADPNTCPVSVRPDLPEFIWDGEWHLLQWHTKMSTGTNVADGVHEAWLDGVKFLESTSLVTDPDPPGFATGSAGKYFGRFALGRNADPIDASSMYWGRLRIYDQDPGWSP